ncbi:FAR1-related sequence 5-like protein [Tanacetum coccineum]
MAILDLNQPASSLSEEDEVAASNSHVVPISSSNNTRCDSFASHDDNASCFGIRLYCQKRLKCGYVKQKYIVCNREGCPKEVWLNTLDPKKNDRQVRSSNFRVCGCKARVVFDMVPHTSKYTLTTFDVEHNHELDRAANANIGAVRAHNLYTGLKDSDAQMLITRMDQRQEFTKEFYFDYFLEDAELCGLFWADEVAKCNYKEFSDIVSFDATYKTNKYKMVFVPFTAIDNHRRSVTVGSGLLKKETAEAYGWLLRAFKKAFVRPPNIVVTDQDGAMRLAVAAEFPESKHRLCMWHIGRNLAKIYDDTDFKDKFGKIVWNMFIGPEEFEDRWNKLMEEFNLVNHKWLSKDVDSSQNILGPTFFVDSPLCGLVEDYFWVLVMFNNVIDKESTSKNVEEEINLHQKFTGHYKNKAIEKFAMEASIILDSCVHMLRNNEPKLYVFVNKMKAIKSNLEAKLPIVPTHTVSDFVQEFMGVKKPDKATQLEKQIGAKFAWFQEKYYGRTHGGIGCSSSQANCPLTKKELHQIRMDKEALKEMLEEEGMNKKAQEEKIRLEQVENNAFFLEFGIVRYDSEYESSD